MIVFIKFFRISLPSVKNNAKETKASPETEEQNDATIDSKMTASVTSFTDQQPAAPKVVLPVLEPSGCLTNTPKQSVEVPAVVLEKDGHYFMNVRIFTLYGVMIMILKSLNIQLT